MVTSVVLPRVTHEKYNMLKSGLESMESLSPDVANTILSMFGQIFEYDPSMKFYSREAYEQNKKYHLERTGGKQGVPDSKIRAYQKYNETHREERNQKAKEIYHKKKLEKQMNLTSNLIKTQ
jgi:hypothetical protein